MHLAPAIDEHERARRFPADIVKRLGEHGWLGIPYPESEGGTGLDTLAYAIAVEEIGRVWGSLGLIVAAHTSLGCGPLHLAATPEQKADLYLAGTHAVQSSALVGRWAADAAGSSVIYRDGPLERIVRDMETLRHHGFVNESRYGSVAQLRWGAALDYPLMLR